MTTQTLVRETSARTSRLGRDRSKPAEKQANSRFRAAESKIGRLRASPEPSAMGGGFPIEPPAGSQSGKWLLVGTLGIDTSSSSPQSDLWLVEISAMKLTKAGSGNSAAWLPARDVFFYTHRATSILAARPGSAGRLPPPAWRLLMTFDSASAKTTAVTSGVTNNLPQSICGK